MTAITANVQSISDGSLSGTTLTLSSYVVPSGTNKILTVFVACEKNPATTVSTVTHNGVSLTKRGELTHSGGQNRVEIWDLQLGSTTPSGDVVVTFALSPGPAALGVVTTKNLVQQAPEATNSASATTSPFNTNITSVTNNAFILDVASSNSDSGVSVTQGPTQNKLIGLSTGGGTMSFAVSEFQGGALGVHTLGWTIGAGTRLPHLLTAYESSATTTITDFDTDEDVYPGQTAATITGTDFEATKGTGSVKISPTDNILDGNTEVQTTTSWAATSIDVTVVQGGLPFGPLYLFVENDSSASNSTGFSITLSSASGKANETMVVIDGSGLSNNFIGLAVGDQIEYETTSTGGGTVVVNDDGTFDITYGGSPPASDSFQARAWDQTDYTWTSFETININESIGLTSGRLDLGLSLGL